MWKIKNIFESDYGCEERMPGEPDTVIVIIESDDGQISQFEVADDWLQTQGLDEGDEWPDEFMKLQQKESEQAIKITEWMENYIQALDEMNGN